MRLGHGNEACIYAEEDAGNGRRMRGEVGTSDPVDLGGKQTAWVLISVSHAGSMMQHQPDLWPWLWRTLPVMAHLF